MNEEKDLLLKYLCMALPYRIAIKDDYGDTTFLDYNDVHIQNYFEGIVNGVVRPYLRTLASMTYEEREFVNNNFLFYGGSVCYTSDIYTSNELVLWLLEHHFDYMGLIPKGLAIEVTEENNPYKK